MSPFISVIPGLSAPDVSGIVPPPDDYELMMVRRWDEPVMQSYGFSVNRGGAPVGQFQVVTCYVWSETEGRWSGQWSAISNYNKLTHSDMLNIGRLQLLEHHYPFWIDGEDLLLMQNVVLPDGFTLKQKMGWLYNPLTQWSEKPATEIWGIGEWHETTEARFGTMVNGGQMVAVSKERRIFQVRMPERMTVENVPMRKLLTFKRADFGKSHEQYPYLLQWATAANLPDNSYGEYMRGHIAVPVALEPDEFDFSGIFRPTDYYLPEVWLRGVV
jgi:hypothetical protein